MNPIRRRISHPCRLARTARFLRGPVLLCAGLAVSAPAVFSQHTAIPFAVKTNLLFDAATALNIEAEASLGPQWSMAGEWISPWWQNASRQRTVQIGAGTLELRRWWGDRTGPTVMTGWFAGLYAGGGYYDLEWNRKGRQGEFFHAGISGGFAHAISPNGHWRMEYSLGLGYMSTEYHRYTAVTGTDDRWHLVRQHSGTYQWVGPTRAKVSLVWMPEFRPGRKGGER